MEAAPFHSDLAEGPKDVQSFWTKASDGVRLRVVRWPLDHAKGTILLFTGRTEYAEKYGRTAFDLTKAGFDLITLDWRGQGLSDRVSKDPMVGHINGFAEYQRDVDALVRSADMLNCPKPWFLVGHSMGGCIGLRTLVRGFDVEKAVFSAPMWGINLPAWVRPLPYFVPQIMGGVGMGERFAPGAGHLNYVLATDFPENMLTTDRDTYDYLYRQADAVPEFALAGPSAAWIGHAAYETRALRAAQRPKVPVVTFLGSDEKIVSASAVKTVHANWPQADLRLIEKARHEIMMEAPAARDRFIAETVAFFLD